MPAASISMSGVARMNAAFLALANVTETPAARAVLSKASNGMASNLRDHAPRDTGRLAAAISTGFFDKQPGLSAAAVVGVKSDAFYWRYTNQRGRSAGWVEAALTGDRTGEQMVEDLAGVIKGMIR